MLLRSFTRSFDVSTPHARHQAGRAFFVLITLVLVGIVACASPTAVAPPASLPGDAGSGAPTPVAVGACADLERVDSFESHASDQASALATAEAQPEAQHLLADLESAYATGNSTALGAWFEAWGAAVSSRSEEEIAAEPEAVQAVYAAYPAFYRPLDLSAVGGSSLGDDLYALDQYVVVQNELPVLCVDSMDGALWDPLGMPDPARITVQSIVRDFRPPLGDVGATPLYLTVPYEAALRAFLGEPTADAATADAGTTVATADAATTEAGTTAATSDAATTEPTAAASADDTRDSADRAAFLRPFIRVFRGTYGDYWYLETHPQAQVLVFDQALQKARVLHRVVGEGGHVDLARQDGGWSIVAAQRDWDE